MNKIKEILLELNTDFSELTGFIQEQIANVNKTFPEKREHEFCSSDNMLITYADQFEMEGKNNLEALNTFLSDELEGCLSIVHLLPFYPWTSDDGFSPVEYDEVCEDYGSWDDVENIKNSKMFDCVFNHISSKNSFFQKALAGDHDCEKMFHVFDEKTFGKKAFQDNIPMIVRPRTSSLFTQYNFKGENKYVWTTFSADQIDTNLADINMIKYILKSFFLYINKGAQYFRIDAVPFMWKELGTNCSHLPKTHLVVQLFRAIIDEINKPLYLVTESNVPHSENISYWGNGENEAHIIYNFSLSPLLLHGITFESCEFLNKWAKKVFDIHPKTTFLNFTATHDGIGMRGLEGIINDKDIEALCQKTLDKGGEIGKKRSRDGTVRPYELNITWASFMASDDLDEETYIKKVVNSQALIMFLPGIGAHYIHNFLGTHNWDEGYKESGIARRLNRKKLKLPLKLDSVSKEIKKRLIELIKFKSNCYLFAANTKIKVLSVHPKCFAFERYNEKERIVVYFNLSNTEIKFEQVTLGPYELKFS